MLPPSNHPLAYGLLGPDPGRGIRIWVAMLLRLGLGISMLNTGLTGYFGMQGGRGGGMMWGMGPGASMLDPFLSGLPYLAIAIGMALILGFLTTPAAIAAGFSGLIIPLLTLVQIALAGVTGGGMNMGNRWGNDLFSVMMMMSMPTLLINSAMIWLSPLENNPISVDAMIFGRNELEPMDPLPEPIPQAIPAEEEAPLHIGE